MDHLKLNRGTFVRATAASLLVSPLRRAICAAAAEDSVQVLRAADVEDAEGGVLVDLEFLYDFSDSGDSIFIGNIAGQNTAGLGDVPSKGWLRYTTDAADVAFRQRDPSTRELGRVLYTLNIATARTAFKQANASGHNELPQLERSLAYGRAQYGIGNDKGAIHQLGGVLTQPNGYWNPETRLLMASAYQNIGDLANAKTQYSWIASHPSQYSQSDVLFARIGLARVERASGDLEAAQEQYDQILSGGSGTSPHRRHLSNLTSASKASSSRQARFGDRALKRQQLYKMQRNLTIGSGRILREDSQRYSGSLDVRYDIDNPPPSFDFGKAQTSKVQPYTMTDVGSFLQGSVFNSFGSASYGGVSEYASTWTHIILDNQNGTEARISLLCVTPTAAANTFPFEFRVQFKTKFTPFADVETSNLGQLGNGYAAALEDYMGYAACALVI